jgi:Citrate synthase, C-terminal domain
MSGPHILEASQDRLASEVGGWFPGQRTVFRGKDLHHDLADLDWMELYVYGITGRRFSPVEVKMLHRIWTYTSYPDARLWNNRVAAVAGSARSTGSLAISAAMAVSEASIYGGRPVIRCIDFLQRTKRKLETGGENIVDIVKWEIGNFRSIAGYGRPIVGVDERIAPMMKLAKELGMDQRPFVRLAFDVERALLEGRYRLRMNFAALAAALVADMGFSAREYYLYVIPCFVAGMLPCFIEASAKPEGSFLPLPCERVRYEGASERAWE